jgi:hypothetical protein
MNKTSVIIFGGIGLFGAALLARAKVLLKIYINLSHQPTTVY